MKTPELNRSLHALFSELVEGAPAEEAYILNRDDQGLQGSYQWHA